MDYKNQAPQTILAKIKNIWGDTYALMSTLQLTMALTTSPLRRYRLECSTHWLTNPLAQANFKADR